MSIEAMKQALEALALVARSDEWQGCQTYEGQIATSAYEALRQAIEFEEMVKKGTKAWDGVPDDWVDELRGGAEPVAFRNTETGEFCTGGFLRKDWAKWQPLYAAPVHARPVVHAVRCTYPQCQATNGCVGACSKGQAERMVPSDYPNSHQQEPVGWLDSEGRFSYFKHLDSDEPLYAAPVHASDISQERVDETAKSEHEWVGLTDKEREQVRSSAGYNQFMSAGEYAELVQWATEAKLKEKNVSQP